MFSHGIFVNSIIDNHSMDGSFFAGMSNNINNYLLVDVKIQSPLVNVDLSGNEILGNLIGKDINDIFAEENEAATVVETEKSAFYTQLKKKKEEGYIAADDSDGLVITKGTETLEWNTSENQFVIKEEKSGLTNDDKETIKKEIKNIIKEYDEYIEDEELNNLVEKLVNGNPNDVKNTVEFEFAGGHLSEVKELIKKYKKCN